LVDGLKTAGRPGGRPPGALEGRKRAEIGRRGDSFATGSACCPGERIAVELSRPGAGPL